MNALKVGVIGCGNISDVYFENGKRFEAIDIVACADLLTKHAESKAKQHGVERVLTPEELLAEDDIAIVLNLTTPGAHAEIARRALESGKHVYSEKPLALTREEGKMLLELAQEKGRRIGCAPDTVLGAGIQTARKLIDDGWIGEPVSATAAMQCRGHESWHPSPEFYYQLGGGPMFDMGPYYLSALVTLLGPMAHVNAATRTTFPKRLISSAPKRGAVIEVETPTHLAGVIEFENGALCTMITSFDVWRASLPCIEIHGKNGSISVPDPNGFGGDVAVFRPGYDEWKVVPHTHAYANQSRGLGLAEMAAAIMHNQEHRASGELAYHALDAMHAFLDAGETQQRVALDSRCERPEPMPMNLLDGQTEEIFLS